MGHLEIEHQEKQAAVAAAERENKLLRLKSKAMEHVLAARERQLAILKRYQQLCGPESRPESEEDVEEALRLQEAASLSMPDLVSPLTEEAFISCLFIALFSCFNGAFPPSGS